MKKVILDSEGQPAVLVSEASDEKYYGAEHWGHKGCIFRRGNNGFGFELTNGIQFGFKKEQNLISFLRYAGFYYSIYEFDTYKELENWETKK